MKNVENVENVTLNGKNDGRKYEKMKPEPKVRIINSALSTN